MVRMNMDKEILIDGVLYRVVENPEDVNKEPRNLVAAEYLPKDPKEGDEFEFRGYKWVVLEYDYQSVTAIMKTALGNMPFDVDGTNNWAESSLRKVLNIEFLSKLGGSKYLYETDTDLEADNGDESYGYTRDYVTILSCDDYRIYRKYIPNPDWSMWTCTPLACPHDSEENPWFTKVRYISTAGYMSHTDTENPTLEVFPVCKFRRDIWEK